MDRVFDAAVGCNKSCKPVIACGVFSTVMFLIYLECVQLKYILFTWTLQKFDAVVGDITITANRSLHVEFSQPYTTGGVEMVIPIKHGNRTKLLFFFQTFSWDVCNSYFAIFFAFVVIWSFEHPEELGTMDQIFKSLKNPWKLLSALLAETEGVKVVPKNAGMIFLCASVVLIGLFVQILFNMSVADGGQLTTVDPLNLARSGEIVGYQKGSFVKMILEHLKFNESQLKAYDSMEEYDDALSKGSQNGGVAAVFDEIPYIKLFLNKYCVKYRRVGPTYRIEGFGFAFPKGSPLVSDVSTAISSLMEEGMIQKIESTWLEPEETCSDIPSHIPTNALSLNTIWGVFVTVVIRISTLLPLFMVANLNRHFENKISKALRIIFQIRRNAPADHKPNQVQQVLDQQEHEQDQPNQDEQVLDPQEQEQDQPSQGEQLDESDAVEGHPLKYTKTA